MGVDLTLHFKKDKRKKGTIGLGLSRTFLSMVGEGKYGVNPTICEFARVIKMDISFLLEIPEYTDPEEAVYWAQIAEVDTKRAKQDAWKANKFMLTKDLSEKVSALIDQMKSYPDYHQHMIYDRESWKDYFGKRLMEDLIELLNKLKEMDNNGFRWVSSEVA